MESGDRLTRVEMGASCAVESGNLLSLKDNMYLKRSSYVLISRSQLQFQEGVFFSEKLMLLLLSVSFRYV